MFWKKEIVGDKQTITRFAFLPTDLNDGVSVWLQRYYVEQEYRPNQITRMSWTDLGYIECVPGWKDIKTYKKSLDKQD